MQKVLYVSPYMHYLVKKTKIEFQSFKVKEDTKALSKMAKEVSRIQSMVTYYRARTEWAVLVQSSPCPYTVGMGLVCVENNCFFCQSGNPETCKCLKQWIPAFTGMTYKCVIFSF